MKRLLFLVPALGFMHLSSAQEAARPATPPAPASNPAEAKPAEPAAKPPRYELKTKSTFDVSESMRAPFLPIGWVKPAPNTPVIQQQQQVTLDPTGFRLTSLLLGNPSLAVINGRSYEEGQFLRLPRTGPQVRVQLYRIGDGQVWLKMDDKLFIVPLKRPELGERKPDETLLNEERDAVPMIPAAPGAPATAPAPAPGGGPSFR